MIVISGHAFLELHEVEGAFDKVTLAYIKEYCLKDISGIEDISVSKLTTLKPAVLVEAQSEIFFAEDEEREPVFSQEQIAALEIEMLVHNTLVSLGGNDRYSYVVKL